MKSKQLRQVLNAIGLLGVMLVTAATLTAQGRHGSVLPYASESPHPYSAGSEKRSVVWQEHLTHS